MKSKRAVKGAASDATLFDRVGAILEHARASVVQSVNSSMVAAYWLIGREIVLEVQGGEVRAEYGKQVIESLSARLAQCYGNGYSVTNLQYFRKFYLAFPDRLRIPRPWGAELVERNEMAGIVAPQSR